MKMIKGGWTIVVIGYQLGVVYLHIACGTTRACSCLLHLLNDVVSLKHLAKDDVFSIQPSRFVKGNKELRPIGILPRIRHGERSVGGSVLEGKEKVIR